MIGIRTFTRPDGQAGYACGYMLVNGIIQVSPQVELARFEMSKEGRREARMWRNGFEAGVRVAAEQLAAMAPPKPADEPV